MSASKDIKRGTWKVYIRYTDWTGEKQVKTKRGFATKKEAQQWEREFLQKQCKDINMNFAAFVDIYLRDKKPRLKYSTYIGKKHLLDTKILPYFGKHSLVSIKASDVIQWQNELLNQRDPEGNSYSPTYLRTIQNQLSAVLNHATRFYGLPVNPSAQAGKMGKANAKEMLFWTQEEYLRFIETMKSKPMSYYAFEMLYWTGIREGELLALTPVDFDFENRKLTINKSYQRLKGDDYITEPKTEQSNRTIALSSFLCEEMEDFFVSLYGLKDNARIFQITKSYLHHEMDRGCKESGVKRIRIHDLRHSHVAHLIELGFSPVVIAERLGHKGISITYMYAHLYPSKQFELADKLEWDREKVSCGAEKIIAMGQGESENV
ncbi:MAG: site-specific integrase [Lachnospiraceae bacterium]